MSEHKRIAIIDQTEREACLINILKEIVVAIDTVNLSKEIPDNVKRTFGFQQILARKQDASLLLSRFVI